MEILGVILIIGLVTASICLGYQIAVACDHYKQNEVDFWKDKTFEWLEHTHHWKVVCCDVWHRYKENVLSNEIIEIEEDGIQYRYMKVDDLYLKIEDGKAVGYFRPDGNQKLDPEGAVEK